MTPGPPVVRAYDPLWASTAEDLLDELRSAASRPDWIFDHIGSTSVPGLAAKHMIDLQVRVPCLPSCDELDDLLVPLQYPRELGARLDSPGVYRDNPRGNDRVPDEVWEKRLYVRPGPLPVVLHVRRVDSPFGLHTVWFRDWLRTHDDERDRYAETKLELAAQQANASDFDDYTRAKTAYFDRVHDKFERWAQAQVRGSVVEAGLRGGARPCRCGASMCRLNEVLKPCAALIDA